MEWLSGSELVSLVGVSSTLIVSVVGWVVIWKLEKARRDHEDRNRYQAARKETYATLSQLLAKYLVSRIAGDPDFAAALEIQTELRTIQLIGSLELITAATTASNQVSAVADMNSGLSANKAIQNFVRLAREELGTPPLESKELQQLATRWEESFRALYKNVPSAE